MLHHAYVIAGKGKAAHKEAERLLALHGVERGAHPNKLQCTYELFGIDEARSLKEWAYLTSFGGGKKVALIETRAFTPEAQHALLKVLEEPPASVVFIFIVPEEAALLATVRSRVALMKSSDNNTHAPGEKIRVRAEQFLVVSLKDRLALAAKIAGDIDRTRDFLDALERALGERVRKEDMAHLHTLNLLYEARHHLSFRGASRKMLLENLALSF